MGRTLYIKKIPKGILEKYNLKNMEDIIQLRKEVKVIPTTYEEIEYHRYIWDLLNNHPKIVEMSFGYRDIRLIKVKDYLEFINPSLEYRHTFIKILERLYKTCIYENDPDTSKIIEEAKTIFLSQNETIQEKAKRLIWERDIAHYSDIKMYDEDKLDEKTIQTLQEIKETFKNLDRDSYFIEDEILHTFDDLDEEDIFVFELY